MGTPLARLLVDGGNEVYVTSRQQHVKAGRIHFIQGNAKDLSFLASVLKQEQYDAVVDFMSYTTNEFERRYRLFLDSTQQYVFISSARVFAESAQPLTEDSPRLLDTSTDLAYLETDEYGLAKARQEDLLKKNGRKNYTIVRPSVTYNDYRLQLGALEKENWLYRAMHGRSIVFSEDIACKLTAMTHGDDVAKAIASLIGNKKAYGMSFNVASDQSYTWSEILDFYLSALRSKGIDFKVVMSKETIKMKDTRFVYQVKYARRFNRVFCIKALKDVGDADFRSPKEGVGEVLGHFLEKPMFLPIDWRYEAWSDRISGEYTPLSEIPSIRNKVMYICYRNHVEVLYCILMKVWNLCKIRS